MTEVEARSAANRLHDQLETIVELLHRHEEGGRLPADALAEIAREVFGDDRVEVAERLDDAIEQAIASAEANTPLGGAGVVITGSIVTVGEARHLLHPDAL